MWRHSMTLTADAVTSTYDVSVSKTLWCVISVSRQATLNNSFVYNVLWVKKFSPGTTKCVTLMDDLEIQGYIVLHVTLPISTTAHARKPNFFLSLMFYKPNNSFRVLPNVWLNEWPWIPRSHYFLRDLTYLNYYTCCNTEFQGQIILNVISHTSSFCNARAMDIG